MKDKLISAAALKHSFCAECNHSIKCDDCDIDYHIEHAPAVDPKCSGQWMRYDLIIATIRGMSAQHADEGDGAGARALEELAQYFDQISCMVGGE